MANDTFGSSALKDDFSEEVKRLNDVSVSSVWGAKKILEELKSVDGEIIDGSNLEKSIQGLGIKDITDIDQVISDLEKKEKIEEEIKDVEDKSPDEKKTSVVDEAKIRELVEEYQKYTEEKGFSDKEALDQIYKENKGNIASKELENFLQKERSNYQEKINIKNETKEVKEEKPEVKTEVKNKVVDLDDYRKSEPKEETVEVKEKIVLEEEKITNEDETKSVVEEKIEEISKKTREVLGGDDNFEKKIQTEIESIIKEDQIKTSSEEIEDLSEIMAEELQEKNDSEIKIEAKKIKIEIEKWTEENAKEVNDFRKEKFEENFESETKKLNPHLKMEEAASAKEYSNLISETIFTKNIIDGQKDVALQANNQFGPGKLENAWTELKTITSFLTKKPEQIIEIKNRYEKIKSRLGRINLPENRFIRSFENVISNFRNPEFNNLFSKVQRQFDGSTFNRLNNLTGGWLNKTITGAGEKLIGKIGNQAVSEFAKNSLGVLAKEGFQKGITTLLKGVLSGGIKAATAMAGTVAASATGVGAIAMAAMKVAKIIKDVVGKIAEKLGINIKGGLQEVFGKTGGKIIEGIVSLVALSGVLTGAAIVPIATIGIILIVVFGGILGYSQFSIAPLASSLVPPRGVQDSAEMSSDINEGFSQAVAINDLNGTKIEINYTYNTNGNLNLDFIEQLPQFKTFKRSDLIAAARAVLGLPYYWGGGHNDGEPVKGIDPKWGRIVEGDTKGRIYYGLDCSGFVTWVYYQVTGKNILNGATGIYNNSVHITEDQLLPGDIGIQCPNGCLNKETGEFDEGKNHIGIYLGIGADGQKYFIHSGGINTNGGPQGLGGVVISTWPFKAFCRINQENINLINDL